jgi:hypothetical protein
MSNVLALGSASLDYICLLSPLADVMQTRIGEAEQDFYCLHKATHPSFLLYSDPSHGS